MEESERVGMTASSHDRTNQIYCNAVFGAEQGVSNNMLIKVSISPCDSSIEDRNPTISKNKYFIGTKQEGIKNDIHTKNL